MKKKLLSSLLGVLFVTTAHAAVGSIPKNNLNDDMDLFVSDSPWNHNFYTVVINHSSKTDVDIYTKNGMHWNNWGWCDGDSSGKLSIAPGQTKVYCGGSVHRAGGALPIDSNDISRIQHEWWFNKNGSWNQTYSEQWMIPPSGTANLEDAPLGFSLIRLIENNNWSDYWSDRTNIHPFVSMNHMALNAFYYALYTKVSQPYMTAMGDYITSRLGTAIPDASIAEALTHKNSDNNVVASSKLSNNTVLFYEINEDATYMNISCYSLPVKFNWKDVNTMRQGQNLCPNVRVKI